MLLSPEAQLRAVLQQAGSPKELAKALARSPSWDPEHYHGEHPLAYALRNACGWQVVEPLIKAAPKPLGALRLLVEGQPQNMAGFVLGHRFNRLHELPALLAAGLRADDRTTRPGEEHLTPMKTWLNAAPYRSNFSEVPGWLRLGQELVAQGASVHESVYHANTTGMTLLHEVSLIYLNTPDRPGLVDAAQWLIEAGLSPQAKASGSLSHKLNYIHEEMTALSILLGANVPTEGPLVRLLQTYEYACDLTQHLDDPQTVVSSVNSPQRRPRL